MDVRLTRRLFTVDEYYQMARAGILTEDDRVELLEGEIVQMTPIGSRHAACVDRLTELFSRHIAERAIVRVQSPVRLSERSEPQPDLTLLRRRSDFYAGHHPGPEDVLLLVEVAETSAEPDRGIKLPLYARAGISEVWLVDLGAGAIEVYRRPSREGYQETFTVRRGDPVSPATFPDVRLAAAGIFG